MNRCLLCRGAVFSPIKRTDMGKQIGRCTRCGFVQIYPRITSQEQVLLYTDDWVHFTPYISQLQAHHWYFRRMLRFLIQVAKQPITSLLDVGCALGVLLKEAKKVGISAEGIDISQAAVLYAKKQHLRVYHDTCIFWEKRENRMHKYDLITAFEVIEHEKDPFAMLRSIFRMLRPDGIVAITTPNYNTLFRTLMGKSWIGYRHHEHLWFFTPDSITRLLKKTGFSHIKVRRDFIRPYSVSFMCTRLGDYIHILRPITNVLASLTKHIPFSLPFNPWGDMLVIARK
jgi:2-polyprenyl-3-methyl-5-hydroxy-6-metoxy-1,4-benzoquinol methylase